MIRTISSSPSSTVCTTSNISTPSTRPIVCHRSSPSTSRSRLVACMGSLNTSKAVSKLTRCFRRLLALFLSSHSKRKPTAYTNMYIQNCLFSQALLRSHPRTRSPPGSHWRVHHLSTARKRTTSRGLSHLTSAASNSSLEPNPHVTPMAQTPFAFAPTTS